MFSPKTLLSWFEPNRRTKVKELKTQLKIKAREIAAYLKTNKHEIPDHPSLMNGRAGVALSLFYYHRYVNPDVEYYDFALEQLQLTIDDLGNSTLLPTFSNGLAGVGWVIEHLIKGEFIHLEDSILLERIDDLLGQYVYTVLQNDPDPDLDFLHGLTGIAYYFLYRKTKIDCIESILEKLKQLSILEPDGARKWVFQNTLHKEGVYDLGLAHGIASLISFLSSVVESGYFEDLSKELLHGSIKYLLKQEHQNDSLTSRFPRWVKLNSSSDEASAKSKISWCYGDLGIAVSLLNASKVLKNTELNEKAIEILKATSVRKSVASTGIICSCLCHGSIGNGFIYHHLWRLEQKKFLKDAAIIWLNNALAKAVHLDGPGGFKEEFLNDESKITLGLLNGAAGILISISSVITDEVTEKWHSCILI